jgi:CheY-like chemotaxis protein
MELQRLDNLKIVVVDDQEKVRSSVSHFLADKGAQVKTCRNVDEALEAVPRLHPDLIISDIRMPEKDGFELLHAVRSLDGESSREVPVIAMTAHEPETEEIIASPPVFDGFLPKPFTPTALMRTISDVLAR